MSSHQSVALASSGSPASDGVAMAAFNYCTENKIKELLVIHILETQLSKFGEIDQLADASSKADFVNYIKEEAHINARLLFNRLTDRASKCDIQLRWQQKEGDPFTEIHNIASTHGISLLFIGQGAPPESYFSPPKNLAKKLVKHCSCHVAIISAEDSKSTPEQL